MSRNTLVYTKIFQLKNYALLLFVTSRNKHIVAFKRQLQQ